MQTCFIFLLSLDLFTPYVTYSRALTSPNPFFGGGGGVPLNYDFEFYGGEARFTQEKIENHYTGQVEKTTLQSLYIPVHRKKTATLKGWQRWNPVDHS